MPPSARSLRPSLSNRRPLIAHVTRRVGIAALVVVVSAGAAVGIWAIRAHDRHCEVIGAVQQFPDNSVSFVKCVPAFVVHGVGADFAVYVARSPHLANEPLQWDATRRVFVSPLHGETYDVRGRHLSGPGGPALWRCPSDIRSGLLTIEAPPNALGEPLPEICETIPRLTSSRASG